jgi:hypothetical protein
MLQRNLLYTAVTRAERIVVLIGSKRALAKAVRTPGVGRRYTALTERRGPGRVGGLGGKPDLRPTSPNRLRLGLSRGRCSRANQQDGEVQAAYLLHIRGASKIRACLHRLDGSPRTHDVALTLACDLARRRPRGAQPSITDNDEVEVQILPEPSTASNQPKR